MVLILLLVLPVRTKPDLGVPPGATGQTSAFAPRGRREPSCVMDSQVIALVVASVLAAATVAILWVLRARRRGGVLVVGSAEGRADEEPLDGSGLVAASALVGSPVVSTRSGERLATVKDVVYSPADGAVEGFTLNPRNRFGAPMREVLPASLLGEVGPDAVVVEGPDSFVDRAQAPQSLSATRSGRNVIGSRVITETGREIGEVVDVLVRAGTRPTAVGYEVQRSGSGRRRFVPLSEQRGISGEALIVPRDTEALLSEDLVELDVASRQRRRRRGPGR